MAERCAIGLSEVCSCAAMRWANDPVPERCGPRGDPAGTDCLLIGAHLVAFRSSAARGLGTQEAEKTGRFA